jgi:putative colanic acid biosynthesis acetyltransferase WcaF
MNTFQIHRQSSTYASPWPVRTRVRVLLWELCWSFGCAWTPKPFNAWRLFWLRRFGTTVHGAPFVHGRALIVRPWNLTLHELSCLGDGAVAYCLDRVELGIGSTVAQGAYLCTGTHDFDDPHTPLKTAPISVGAHAFIGLRAIVMPGVQIAAGSIVGAGAVVTKDTEEWGIYGSNPARRIGTRRRSAPT